MNKPRFKPYTQRLTNDCFVTTIGSLLGISPAKLPDFMNHEDTLDSEDALQKTNGYLEKHDVVFMTQNVYAENVGEIVAFMRRFGGPKLIYTISGKNESGNHHIWIYKNGRMLHDVSPYNLLKEKEPQPAIDDDGDKFFQIGYLVYLH